MVNTGDNNTGKTVDELAKDDINESMIKNSRCSRKKSMVRHKCKDTVKEVANNIDKNNWKVTALNIRGWKKRHGNQTCSSYDGDEMLISIL